MPGDNQVESQFQGLNGHANANMHAMLYNLPGTYRRKKRRCFLLRSTRQNETFLSSRGLLDHVSPELLFFTVQQLM